MARVVCYTDLDQQKIEAFLRTHVVCPSLGSALALVVLLALIICLCLITLEKWWLHLLVPTSHIWAQWHQCTPICILLSLTCSLDPLVEASLARPFLTHLHRQWTHHTLRSSHSLLCTVVQPAFRSNTVVYLSSNTKTNTRMVNQKSVTKALEMKTIRLKSLARPTSCPPLPQKLLKAPKIMRMLQK